ncbi:MAG: hypothetical protein ABEI31_06460 [Halodesulfurarchaeum sp.]
MSLDALQSAVDDNYAALDGFEATLDQESRMELAMLMAALDTEEPEDLVRRAVHVLFQSSVDTGKLDFHLRGEYDVTYDEYLSGMTYDEMTQGMGFPQQDDDDRRYQF